MTYYLELARWLGALHPIIRLTVLRVELLVGCVVLEKLEEVREVVSVQNDCAR